MVDILVKNNRNPHKAVKFSVNLQKFVDKKNDGEEKYYLEIGTTHSGIQGVKVAPYYLDDLKYRNLDFEISDIVGILSSYIDWGKLLDDTEAPFVSHIEPVGDNVSIFSNIRFTVEDLIPTTGIDLSELKVFLSNGITNFDITSELVIDGTPFKYSFFWKPKIRELNI